MPFLRYMINTMIIVIGNIIGVLISCSIVGFAFARLRFRGSKVLFYILIVTMLIPWQALMVPQFLFFVKIGWYGTYLPLIVPSFTGTAFFIFLIRQYMRTIPKDLDDAARVDGLNTWQIFWRIILPLSTPVLTVCAVFTFLWSWNNLLGPLIYLDSDEKFTVAIGLANLVTDRRHPLEPHDGRQPRDHHPDRDRLLLRPEEADRRHRIRRTEGMTAVEPRDPTQEQRRSFDG